MTEGRQRDEWARWSYWIASYLNTQIDPKKTQPFQPKDFNPFCEADRQAEENKRSRELLQEIKNRTYQG